MLKKVLIGVAALVGLLVAVGFVLPSKWKVERSVVVEARPETIHPLLTTPRRWLEWAAWNNDMDPTAQYSYAGPESGAGAAWSWKGEALGTGTMTLTESDPSKGVSYEMVMEAQQTPAKGSLRFSAEGTGTRVTWVDEGDMGMFLPGRYFISMLEGQLSEHFDIGLKKLKAEAEKAQAVADKAAAEAAARAAAEAAAAAAAAEAVAAPAAP